MERTPACCDNVCGAQHCLQRPRLPLHRWACLQRRHAYSLGLLLPNGIGQQLLQRLCCLSLCAPETRGAGGFGRRSHAQKSEYSRKVRVMLFCLLAHRMELHACKNISSSLRAAVQTQRQDKRVIVHLKAEARLAVASCTAARTPAGSVARAEKNLQAWEGL